MQILALIAAAAASTAQIPIPGGQGGIGFDDLTWSPKLHRVIVPGGRTGNLDLVDLSTRRVTAIAGFSQESSFSGGHGKGTTSADEGRGLLFASDRSKGLLVVVDPATRAIVASARLAGGPDYVRFVAPTGGAWVCDPDGGRLLFFKDAAPVTH